MFCTGTVTSSFNQAKERGAQAVLYHLLVTPGKAARTVLDVKPPVKETISFSSGEMDCMRRARQHYRARLESQEEELAAESGPVGEGRRRPRGTKANRTPLGNPRLSAHAPAEPRSQLASRLSPISCASRPLRASSPRAATRLSLEERGRE